MAQDFADRHLVFQDKHMWKMLLTRAHPDAGGDHETFLFACALKDRLYKEHRPGATERNGPEAHLSAWRTTMTSWASRNREGLKRPAGRSRSTAR